jgi:hypothetical protein
MAGGVLRLDFVRKNFGGTLQDKVDPYNITLTRDTSPSCPYLTPCYSGRFTSPSGATYAPTFYATVFVSGDDIIFKGTSSDYPDRGPQIYSGSSPNDTRKPLRFTGSFVQHNNTENRDWKATFTFYRLS